MSTQLDRSLEDSMLWMSCDRRERRDELFNNRVHEIGALVSDQMYGVAKSREDGLVQKFGCVDGCVGSKHLCFYAYGGIVGSHNDKSISRKLSAFDWAHLDQTPFHVGLGWKSVE